MLANPYANCIYFCCIGKTKIVADFSVNDIAVNFINALGLNKKDEYHILYLLFLIVL